MKNYQALNELFASEEFKEEANKITTADELQRLFATHNVVMDLDEVVELCGEIAKHMEAADSEELSENDLDEVAGGVVTALAVGVAVLCIGALAMGIYNGYKSCKK